MTIILGSQSPQRSRLLNSVIPGDAVVMPPLNDDEPGFEGLNTFVGIEQQLEHIVRRKFADVKSQIQAAPGTTGEPCVICADTIVVANTANGDPVVLGKPPKSDWQATVRSWFNNYYAGVPHQVWTCFQVGVGTRLHLQTVKTEITLRQIDDTLLEWYLATGEPVGKAGGYGIQGIAAMFVESMKGGLTNVVGLPIFEVTEALRELNVISLSKS